MMFDSAYQKQQRAIHAAMHTRGYASSGPARAKNPYPLHVGAPGIHGVSRKPPKTPHASSLNVRRGIVSAARAGVPRIGTGIKHVIGSLVKTGGLGFAMKRPRSFGRQKGQVQG